MTRADLLFEIYLLGRKIRFEGKHKNEDRILEAIILRTAEKNNLTVTSIADLLSTKISAISEKIINLEKSGFITKMKGANNRETLIQLTDKGVSEKNKILSEIETHCTLMTSNVNDSELEHFLTILKKITNINCTI
jgi:DNA-binding MarR family transcriptional regulator